MKKAIDQTIRDLKREVNKKVLKVPGIEQKVLDATSNEPWGPHGSNLADIAQATRNYHEYQMIMVVLWKRINDTGKNWRHVYKALTVLEYLVAHGSERVIDEIREHAYQISTLSDFQYIDSSGRDQGSNVRRKSQSIVVLVNDKERIQEARQKAAANKDKYRNTNSTGGMYRPGSYSSTGGYGERYEDDRYDDRNGYGREREREWGYRDDERYGRDGDRSGRDSEDRYGRDGRRDDDSRGRSRSIDDNQYGSRDDNQYGSRARSSDAYKDRISDDDGHYSSRSSGARAEDHSQGERRLERKFSEQNIGAPPSYEATVNDTRSPDQNERDGVTTEAAAPKASSPTGSTNQDSVAHSPGTAALATTQEYDGFDEFDPRGSVSVAPATASNGEMDLLGSISESFSSNSLALMPVTAASTTTEVDAPVNSSPGSTFVALSSASTVLNQPIEDPFGDSPFKATPTADSVQIQQQYTASASNFQPPAGNQNPEPPQQPYHSEAPQQTAPEMETVSSFEFGDTFQGITYAPSNAFYVQAPVNPQFMPPEPSLVSQNTDILANILPPSGPAGPVVASHAAFPPQSGSPALPSSNVPANLLPQSGPLQGTLQAPVVSHVSQGPPQQSDLLGNPLPRTPVAQPSTSVQPPKDKFETKSTVWADTLSRGLVNLNISGPKINPLADIGIDFESINRKEKREKPVPSTSTSTITMGKAMGSGSGIGRAGAGVIAPPPNPMMGSGMGMGMSGGGMQQPVSMGMGMGGGMNQQPMSMGMGMGMGMGGYGGGMNQSMGMGMGMGMGQGVQMRPPTGLPQGPTMPGNYNPMMGPGGYPQQPPPYGGYHHR